MQHKTVTVEYIPIFLVNGKAIEVCLDCGLALDRVTSRGDSHGR
jgi:hypothetical protein